MAVMTATGWDPARAITIIKRTRRFGARVSKRVLIQMEFNPTNFGDGAQTYPSNGMPCPSPSTVGLNSIYYIIPISPFVRTAGNGPTTFTSRAFPWGCAVPTWGTSGAAAQTITPVMRLICGPAVVTGPSGANALMQARSLCNELTTDTAASDICPTAAALMAFGMVVGR